MRGQPDTGVDLDRLGEEIDGGSRRPTPRWPGSTRASGRTVSRCTPSTSRRTPFHAGLVAAYGAEALRALDEHGLLDLGRPRRGDEVAAAPGARQAGRASRSRTCASTSRTATARAPTTRRTTAARAARIVAAGRRRRAPRRPSIGHPGQVPGGGRPGARRPHPGPLPHRRWPDGGPLPDGFVVTLPKVTYVEQVRGAGARRRPLERAAGLAAGVASTSRSRSRPPQAVLGPDGTATVARMIARRRRPLHRSALRHLRLQRRLRRRGRPPGLDHPAADHAKAVMQVAAAGTGVRLSDGSTNVLPVGTHRARPRRLAAATLRLVRRALDRGYYQGWDMHPAQLPTRYAATYAFYREGLAAAAARLPAYVDAARGGGVLDEPATARALGRLPAARPGLRGR